MATIREQDYRILKAASFVELMDRVNSYLDKGYVTAGGWFLQPLDVPCIEEPYTQAVVYRWTEET